MKGLDRATVAAIWRRLQPLRDRERWRAAFTRDIGLKLISLVVAFGLWAFVNASERDTEQALQVPLELRDIPTGLMVTSPRVDFIDLRVSGPRTLLNRIDRKRLVIPLDLAGMRSGPGVFRVAADSLNLPRGVKIVRLTPAQVTLDLERVVRRTVPVRLQTASKVAAGLRVVDAKISPDSVQVFGPASAVDDLKAIETEPLDLSDAAAGIVEREVGLAEISEYVSFSAQRVAVQVHVSEIEAERELRRLPVAIRHTTYRATVEPPEIRLIVRGPKRAVDSLELNRGEVYIDAAGLAPGKYERAPQVELPTEIEVVRRDPGQLRLRLTKGQR
jgi:YbbR domain-containing protein